MRSPIPIILFMAFVGAMILSNNTNPWTALQEFPAQCWSFLSPYLPLILLGVVAVAVAVIGRAALARWRYHNLDPEFKRAADEGDQQYADKERELRQMSNYAKRKEQELWTTNAQRFRELLPDMIRRAKAEGKYPLVLAPAYGSEVDTGDEFRGYGLPKLADNWGTSMRKARDIARGRGLTAKIVTKPGHPYRGGGGEELYIWL